MKTSPAADAQADTRLGAFLALNHLPAPAEGMVSLEAYWEALPWEEREASGFSLEKLAADFRDFLARAESEGDSCNSFGQAPAIEELIVLRGHDKNGQPEQFDLTFRPGEVVCLVGPTGAGKSRFLADIECMAQGDTPTGRRVLINGQPPAGADRFSGESGLVAQITQNMNFIMDLTVAEFLLMHAESRALAEPGKTVERVLAAAVDMAGEPFNGQTQVTQLSGGQSRALMIADAAFLSPKPIVLIDEIENAGVDRQRALRLFVEKGKIVLLSTHDPILALSGDRRLVIRNGAVTDVIEPDPGEAEVRARLARLDAVVAGVRERLRTGGRVSPEDIAEAD
ncbi:MAG: ATP-binding cassette domain-containing protein [Verrucomicrobiota bacterium JB024]|nr:ATP-binding cassette domain-containing protein [Verrucomicrobiota bacterium JB024]